MPAVAYPRRGWSFSKPDEVTCVLAAVTAPLAAVTGEHFMWTAKTLAENALGTIRQAAA
jgi:hypothetical protein